MGTPGTSSLTCLLSLFMLAPTVQLECYDGVPWYCGLADAGPAEPWQTLLPILAPECRLPTPWVPIAGERQTLWHESGLPRSTPSPCPQRTRTKVVVGLASLLGRHN